LDTRVNTADMVNDVEKRLQDFIDASSDWFWEMDERCRFSYFSERFTEIPGVPQQALLGKTRQETGIPDVDPLVWKQHLDDLTAHRSFRNFVHTRTLPDGRELYLFINGKAIFDDAGNFCGYRGTGTDITAEKAADNARIESRALYERAAKLTRLGHWEWDEIENRCVFCSEELARIHGMAPDVMAKAIDPFFTTKEIGEGSGLGLSMVYGVAKQSGGDMTICSEPGHGTTVRIYLPRVKSEEEQMAENIAEQNPQPGNETIFVIEDNEDVRDMVN